MKKLLTDVVKDVEQKRKEEPYGADVKSSLC